MAEPRLRRGSATKIRKLERFQLTQEFINRSVVVGFVLALAVGAVKLFFPVFPET